MEIAPQVTLRRPSAPIQVYLDSSDYSILSTAMDDTTHPDFPVFRLLEDFVSSKRIEVRFSATHVLEMAHLDEKSRTYAINRAKCLSRLTQGKCFRYWLEAAEFELRSYRKGESAEEQVTSDSGHWHPSLKNLAVELREVFSKELEKSISSLASTRPQRRAVKNKLMRNGYLTSAGLEFFKQPEYVEKRKRERPFPFSDSFYDEDMLVDFCAGRISSTKVVEELGIVFRDVELFTSWTYDVHDPARRLTSWLRLSGIEMAEKLLRSRDQLLSSQGSDAVLQEELQRGLRRAREGFIREISAEVDPKGRNSADSPPFGAVPSFDAFCKGFHSYWLQGLKTNRKLKSSDMADIIHLSHLPYCDVFRADGNSAEVAKDIARAFGSVLVPKLKELPSVIETLCARGR